MSRIASVAAIVIAATALGIAVAALREARERPTRSEMTGAIEAVRHMHEARGGLTPSEMEELLGTPSEVYRDNPRALCWRYVTPYRIEMCWGPKRQQAWIAHNIPPELIGLPLH